MQLPNVIQRIRHMTLPEIHSVQAMQSIRTLEMMVASKFNSKNLIHTQWYASP